MRQCANARSRAVSLVAWFVCDFGSFFSPSLCIFAALDVRSLLSLSGGLRRVNHPIGSEVNARPTQRIYKAMEKKKSQSRTQTMQQERQRESARWHIVASRATPSEEGTKGGGRHALCS